MRVKPAKKRGQVIVEVGSGDSKLLEKLSRTERPVFRLAKILVPIDFSSCSQKALQYAIPFARQFQASLTLLYVAQINYGAGGGTSYQHGKVRKANARGWGEAIAKTRRIGA